MGTRTTTCLIARTLTVATYYATPLATLPEGIGLRIRSRTLPPVTVCRIGADIHAHLSFTYKWGSGPQRSFAHTIPVAIDRLTIEGAPFGAWSIERDASNDRYEAMVWSVVFPATTTPREVLTKARQWYTEVTTRAMRILRGADWILVLGKDTGRSLAVLRAIVSDLAEIGYEGHLVKDGPDEPGESVIQKVLRYALAARFVLIENTAPSGHLYELPHVAKMAECPVAVLQAKHKGATWMFEDAYFKHRHWRKLEYDGRVGLQGAVVESVRWAGAFISGFTKQQAAILPWIK